MGELNNAFLIVTKGEPHPQGEIIPLYEKEILMGRAWEEFQPDISFTSRYISRQLAYINNHAGTTTLRYHPNGRSELKINGKPLLKEELRQLQHGDEIILANDQAILIFFEGNPDDDSTIILDGPVPKPKVTLDLGTRKIQINDQIYILTSKKRFQLFAYLFSQSPKAVSRDELRCAVWPERILINGVPDVGDDEIDAMVYNLKHDLDPYGFVIQTIRGYGYLLDK